MVAEYDADCKCMWCGGESRAVCQSRADRLFDESRLEYKECGVAMRGMGKTKQLETGNGDAALVQDSLAVVILACVARDE